MTQDERRSQAIRAKLALEDGVLGEVFDACEAEIHRDWAEARWRGTRERLHAELRALARVRQRLAGMAARG